MLTSVSLSGWRWEDFIVEVQENMSNKKSLSQLDKYRAYYELCTDFPRMALVSGFHSEILDNVGFLRRSIVESGDEEYWQTLGGLDILSWVPSCKLPYKNQKSVGAAGYKVCLLFRASCFSLCLCL